jgi:ketosteroid isomerase-like protein
MSVSTPPAVAAYLAAVNSFDVDAIVGCFAQDAYVNDARREINGIDAIRRRSSSTTATRSCARATTGPTTRPTSRMSS